MRAMPEWLAGGGSVGSSTAPHSAQASRLNPVYQPPQALTRTIWYE
jgi:hypothetical protein